MYKYVYIYMCAPRRAITTNMCVFLIWDLNGFDICFAHLRLIVAG